MAEVARLAEEAATVAAKLAVDKAEELQAKEAAATSIQVHYRFHKKKKKRKPVRAKAAAYHHRSDGSVVLLSGPQGSVGQSL